MLSRPLIIFFVSVTCIASAQTNLQNIRFRHLTIEDGLPSSSVLCIIQDQQGFMWFGTKDGLCRYDGYNFITYRKQISSEKNPATNSLTDNEVSCMVQDDQGWIWVGNERTGISKLNPQNGDFLHYSNNDKDPFSLNSNDVRAICKDRDGDIWVGTANGINLYNSQTGNFTQFNYQEDFPRIKNVFALYADKYGTIWIGCHGSGLYSYNKQTKKFKRHYLYKDGETLEGQNVVVMIGEDKNDNLWVGTRDAGGLFNFNRKTDNFTRYIFNPAIDSGLSTNDFFLGDILNDRYGNLWIGTFQGGINLFKYSTKRFTRITHNNNIPSSLSHPSTRCIYEDRNGLIWIGTEGGGVNIYNPLTNAFTIFQHSSEIESSISGNSITSIFGDSLGNIWIGNDESGIDIYNESTGKITSLEKFLNSRGLLVRFKAPTITKDGTGRIWISSFGNGLAAYNPVSKNIETGFAANSKYPESLRGLWTIYVYSDKQGILWIADGGALGYFNPFTNEGKVFRPDKTDNYSLTDQSVNTVYEDSRNNLWIGTGKGLELLDKKTFRFTHLKNDANDSTSLGDNFIYTIFEDHLSQLWVGTRRGVSVKSPDNNKFIHYTVKDGLPNENVKAIAEDAKNNIWMATSNGLCCFDPSTKKIISFDISDGLPSNEFTGAFYKTSGGRFYWGTVNGMVSFFPDQVNYNTIKPEVAITGFSVLNKPKELKEALKSNNELVLDHTQYFFTLEFSALDYSAPEKNQYAYKLEGFNKDWVYLGNERKVTFTNLDAGTYSLKVKASNNHGIWSEEKVILKITVTPPWWESKWFYLIILLLVIASIVIFIKTREKKLSREKQTLERKVEERTVALQQEKEKVDEANSQLEKLASVAMGTDYSVIIADKNGIIEWVNAGFTKITGYQLSDVKGTKGEMLSANGKSGLADISLYVNDIRENKPIYYESKYITAQGSEYWAKTNLIPILNKKGDLEKIIAVDMDITEMKKTLSGSKDKVKFLFVDKKGNTKGKQGLIKLPVEEIVWIYALENYVMVASSQKNQSGQENNHEFIYHSTLRQMESLLSKEDFIRINRSYIIRISAIEMIDPGFEYIVMNKELLTDDILDKGDKFRHRNHINIGRAYKQEVKRRLLQS